MCKRDNKAAMDADELFGRQLVGKRFKIAECENRFGAPTDIDLGIILHSFAKQDILEADLNDLIFRFYKNETVIPVMDINSSGEIVADLIHRGQKPFERKRSDQITEYVHLHLFSFLFLFISDTDDDGVVA